MNRHGRNDRGILSPLCLPFHHPGLFGTKTKYNFQKTQFQIIKEYHENKGEKISEKEISQLEKRYRQHEPEQFLIMYDAIRDKSRTDEN